MRRNLSFTLLLFPLALACVTAQASVTPASSATAEWLTQQLHRSVDASQVLAAPSSSSLEGCTITSMRATAAGDTSLRLRCPSQPLPQLILLHLSLEPSAPHVTTQHRQAALDRNTAPAPTVRAGAVLRADWRTPLLHATLPVVAMESGAAGGEIRVRVANTKQIMHARILSAHNVAILSAGV